MRALFKFFHYIHNNTQKQRKKALYTWFSIMMVTIGGYFVSIWSHIMYWSEKGIFSGWVNVWGDWAAHYSFANVFAYRPPSEWFLSHPLYLDKKFTYPFFTDFISGMLMRMHIDIVSSFVLPSIIFTIALLILLYVFYVKVLISPKQAFVAMLLFFLNGGLGFIYFFKDIQTYGLLKTLAFPPQEYTYMREKNIQWINIITSQILPQRSLLLGTVVGLIFLYIIYTWWKTNFKHIRLIEILLVGFLSSSLLLIHTHTLIVFVIICFIFFIFDIKHWKKWIQFAIPAAISCLFAYSVLYGGEISSDFFKWYPGWMGWQKDVDKSFIFFWLMNYGLFLPFSLFSIWKLKWYKKPIVVSGVVLFIVSNLFLFQPNSWDNTKLFFWSHLLLSIPVSRMLASISRNWIGKSIALLLFVVMVLSGFIDSTRLFHWQKLSILEWNAQDIELAKKFREISDPSDVVLTSDQHNHWVSGLTGRQILMGYRGWMWTYGIKYLDREKDMRKMFSGTESTPMLLEKYNISWVIIGPSELVDYGANEEYFAHNYTRVLSNRNNRVYRIK